MIWNRSKNIVKDENPVVNTAGFFTFWQRFLMIVSFFEKNLLYYLRSASVYFVCCKSIL